jgi:mono/diheme cytochrome c family protein
MRFVALTFLVACAGSKDDTSGDNGGGGGGDATAGAEVYSTSCAGCHGANGNDGSAPDLTAEVPSKTDEELTTIITEGTGSMGPVSLDDTQLADLLAHLRATFG